MGHDFNHSGAHWLAGTHSPSCLRISVNVTAHFANNVTGGFTRLRGV